MVAIDKAIDILKENGYKATNKREKILQLFSDDSRMISAKEVQQSLKESYPTISQDTVYRNLHTFVELDLLEETELNGEKRFRFNCQTDGHHHHFICTICGKTTHLEMCPLDFLESQLPGCSITAHRFEVFGKCEQCSRKVS